MLRRQLREAVATQDGSTTVWSEAAIASACQHEGRRLLLLRWLRIEGDKLPVLDRATLLDRIGRATDSRDACLRSLGLDKPREIDPFGELRKGFNSPAAALAAPANDQPLASTAGVSSTADAAEANLDALAMMGGSQ